MANFIQEVQCEVYWKIHFLNCDITPNWHYFSFQCQYIRCLQERIGTHCQERGYCRVKYISKGFQL